MHARTHEARTFPPPERLGSLEQACIPTAPAQWALIEGVGQKPVELQLLVPWPLSCPVQLVVAGADVMQFRQQSHSWCAAFVLGRLRRLLTYRDWHVQQHFLSCQVLSRNY
jgi:hypothetical protein